MALKPKTRPHPIESLTLGANGVQFSSFPNLRLLTISLSPSCRLQGTCLHSPLIPGKVFGKRDASSTSIHSRCFLVYRSSFYVNHPVTASLPSDTQTNSITSNGHVTHCAHPSDKQMETWRGSDLLRLTHSSSGGAGDQSTFEMAEQSVCFLPQHLCGGPEHAQPTWLLHIPACRLASAGNG